MNFKTYICFFSNFKANEKLACIAIALSLLSASNFCYAEEFKNIVLLSSKTGGNYLRFTESFIHKYSKLSKLKYPVNIKTLGYTDASVSTINWNEKNTVFITVGSKAANFVASMNIDAHVIYAMLPYSVYDKISKKAASPCPSETAVIIDQPILRQLNLSRELFPDNVAYSILLGSTSEKRYKKEKHFLGEYLKNIDTIVIQKSRQLAWSLRDLTKQRSVFIAVNDPLVFNRNNAKWLLYMAYQENKPVIGFSKPYVSAGAAAAVYSTPAQLAQQTAESLFTSTKKDSCLFTPQLPVYFNIAINYSIVHSLSGANFNEKKLHDLLLLKEGDIP